MEGQKLDIASKEKEPLTPSSAATYKQIPEDDMEEKTPRPRSLIKEENSTNEPDGADEKMLTKEDTNVAPDSDIMLTNIKFISSEKNGDAKLDIGEVKSEFVGLTKEELMKCANDPFWVRLRWFLFISFWLLWAGMLVGAILIIIAAPKCTPPTPKTWWEEGPLIKAGDDVHLNENSEIDNNQAVIIHYPHDTYNTSSQYQAFLDNNKDSRIILEIDPSASRAWFANAESKGEFSDYYIWAGAEGVDGKIPPNNWLAKNSTDDRKQSAWLYSPQRKQFYFAPDGIPHLNFRNAKVRQEFSSVLERFLAAGVDGFRLKNVPGLVVDAEFTDESVKSTAGSSGLNSYDFYSHFKTENLEELQPIVREWRELIKTTNEDAVMMLADELSNLERYKYNGTLLVDLPRHRDIFNQDNYDPKKLVNDVEASTIILENHWPGWQIDSKSYPPGTLEIVTYLLKGVPIINDAFKVSEELKEARKSPSVLFGTQRLYTAANDTVFAYIRSYPGNPGYLVAFNPTGDHVNVDFPNDIPVVPDEVTVQFFSSNYNETDVGIRLKKSSKDFPISPKSAIILSYVPK